MSDRAPLPKPRLAPWGSGTTYDGEKFTVPERYRTSQDRDDKSGYRPAIRPIALVEATVAEHVHRYGSQPLHVLIAHGERIGVPPVETVHAVLRLQSAGSLIYDLSAELVMRAIPKRLPWWRSIHPAWVLIAFVLLTFVGCCALIAHHSARIAIH